MSPVATCLFVLAMAGGCASVPPPGSYADWVASRPAPANEEQRQAECAWVRGEIGRQQVIGHDRAQEAFGFEILMIRSTMEQNILALEKRGRYAGCFR
jgi:hypothetical protein